jgi:hypothetical protein
MYFSFQVLLLFLIFNFNFFFKTIQTENNNKSRLLVRNCNLRACSKVVDICFSIEEFYVRNECSNLEANKNSEVQIFFKIKVSPNDTELVDVFGYLFPNGTVSSDLSYKTDKRRTKM